MSTDSNRKRGRARGAAPEMIVLSREDAESYAPTGREVCISIADPQAPPARISESFVAVLRLHFDDVVESSNPSDILFGTEHAREIDRFIERWSDAERIVVHCNMGMSRSPGVALGLCDLRGWATAALERSHPGWNRLVRKKLVETGRAESGGSS